MKFLNLLFVFTFCAISLNSFGQKKYVHIYYHNTYISESDSYGHNMYLTGEIPSDLHDRYQDNSHGTGEDVTVGGLMNMLSERGYVLEKALDNVLIMSKQDGEYSPSAIHSIEVEKDEESGDKAHEVARYNLQGLPVSKSEKGVQIIVYSNFTTKTVVVE